MREDDRGGRAEEVDGCVKKVLGTESLPKGDGVRAEEIKASHLRVFFYLHVWFEMGPTTTILQLGKMPKSLIGVDVRNSSLNLHATPSQMRERFAHLHANPPHIRERVAH